MALNFRQMVAADTQVVRGMMHELYREDVGMNKITDEKIDRTFRALFEHPDKGAILVIEEDGEPMGYGVLINFWSNEQGGNVIDIDEVFVRADKRNKGIATAFIRYIADTRFNECVALDLGTTPNNEKARKLYERIGFKLSDVYRYSYKL